MPILSVKTQSPVSEPFRNTMAAIEEIDSFFFKFKHLLLARKNANLTMKSETGKVYVNLALEVDVHPLTGARNEPISIGPVPQKRDQS